MGQDRLSWLPHGRPSATWAALKGRFDVQKGKGHGHRGQHNRWKGRLTWHKTTDD